MIPSDNASQEASDRPTAGAMDKAAAKAAQGLRSYHGNYARYTTNAHGEAVCYFNPCYKAENVRPSAFRFLFKDVAVRSANRLPETDATIQRLIDLADAMVDEQVAEQNDTEGRGRSTIPAGYTYWGQFIDHDLSAGTDRSHEFALTEPDFRPVTPSQVEADIENMRHPFFDLDSLYGDADGPFGDMTAFYGHDGDPVKLRIGTVETAPAGVTPDAELGEERDLPRNADPEVFEDLLPTQAVIGDARNDENLIVAQFHLGLLRFHNAVVDAVRDDAPELSDQEVFERARDEVRLHYQWLVVNDFLQQIAAPEDVQAALDADGLFDDAEEAFMPLEFATAAYRFGHSMVRNLYDFNLNFGRGDSALLERAPFDQLFAFTGRGAATNPRFQARLPNNWIIQWERFFDVENATELDGTPILDRFARRLDPNLAEQITTFGMANEGFERLDPEDQARATEPGVSPARFNAIMKHLARRNLLRGYLLSMPTGQALAEAVGVDVLTPEELTTPAGPLTDALVASGFVAQTPLWLYLLKEADVRADGNRLGPLGSFLVTRTFVGLMKKDPQSFLNRGWTPSDGIVEAATGRSVTGIMDLLRFAGVAKALAVA